MEVRDGTLDDVDTITRHALGVALETEGLRPDPQAVAGSVKLALQDHRKARYFVAEAEGEVIASLFVTFEWSDWNAGWYWWIQGVYVEPDWRRKGVYRAMYKVVQDAAAAAGDVRRVRLYVATENQAAMATYESLGMKAADYRIYDAPVAGHDPA